MLTFGRSRRRQRMRDRTAAERLTAVAFRLDGPWATWPDVTGVLASLGVMLIVYHAVSPMVLLFLPSVGLLGAALARSGDWPLQVVMARVARESRRRNPGLADLPRLGPVRWLRTHGDTDVDPLDRAAVLVRVGATAEARKLIETAPADTATQRMKRAFVIAIVEQAEGSVPDSAALERAEADLPTDDERRYYQAQVAYRYAVAAFTAGQDWRPAIRSAAPLVDGTQLELSDILRIWYVRLRRPLAWTVVALVLAILIPILEPSDIPALRNVLDQAPSFPP